MSGRRQRDWTNYLLIGLIIMFGGVVIYEFFRRRRLRAAFQEEKKEYDEELRKAQSYLDDHNENTNLVDPVHVNKED